MRKYLLFLAPGCFSPPCIYNVNELFVFFNSTYQNSFITVREQGDNNTLSKVNENHQMRTVRHISLGRYDSIL